MHHHILFGHFWSTGRHWRPKTVMGKPPLDLAHKTLRDLIHQELQHILPTANTSEATVENTGVVEGGILVFNSSIYFLSHLFSFLSVLALCPEDCYHIWLFAYPSFFIFQNSRRWGNKMFTNFFKGHLKYWIGWRHPRQTTNARVFIIHYCHLIITIIRYQVSELVAPFLLLLYRVIAQYIFSCLTIVQ